ncbi:helix-turn-helix transcriptional regulator [Photobacterium kasasachensis]|uniref:helix-turn-helix transcriptional regulator n=1 Tax=Photobacterium kasasachensis TaxID=2910240 RepID=UPI003D0C5BD8
MKTDDELNMRDINELPRSTYERLEYLEFMLRFRGWVSRADLKERFGTSDAAATRDIRLYRDYSQNESNEDLNLKLNNTTKYYEIKSGTFKPLFEITIQQVLAKIRKQKFCEALDMGSSNGVLTPPRLGLPTIENLATITRSISSRAVLITKYYSVKNGFSLKKLIPHSIFDNGTRWYMRAWDIEKKSFRSYALSRILSSEVSDTLDDHADLKLLDHQWNRMVKLELVPHPNKKNVSCPQTIEHDFQMKKGCLELSVRATIAGYWLALWNVDCTENHSLKGYQYQLWLRNHQTLYDVESRMIAPGLSDYPS